MAGVVQVAGLGGGFEPGAGWKINTYESKNDPVSSTNATPFPTGASPLTVAVKKESVGLVFVRPETVTYGLGGP
jgi:hypothetical protein